ncbi:MAG: hypothetical protein ACI9MR_000010 [Myxococcota bacterium]|jgi:hypothetical protein
MAVTSGKVEIVVDVRDATSGGPKNVDKLNKGLKKTAKNVKTTERGFLGLKKGIQTSAAKGLVLAAVVTRIVGTIGKAAKEAALFETRMVTAFGSVEKGERAIDALGGVLSSAAFVHGIDRLQQAGVQGGITIEQIDKLTASARRMGIDGDQAFSTFAKGVFEASDLVKDLGINIDQGKAFADYAAEIGRTVAALTKMDKSQAIMNATLAETEVIAASLPDAFGNMDRAMNNMADAVKTIERKVLIPLGDAVADVVNFFIGDSAEQTFLIELGNEWEHARKRIADYDKELERVVRSHKMLPKVIAQSRVQIAKLMGDVPKSMELEFAAMRTGIMLDVDKAQAKLDNLEGIIQARKLAADAAVKTARESQAAFDAQRVTFREANARIRQLDRDGNANVRQGAQFGAAVRRSVESKKQLNLIRQYLPMQLGLEKSLTDALTSDRAITQEKTRQGLITALKLQKQRALAESVSLTTAAHRSGLEALQGQLATSVDLLKQGGASRREIRVAQRNEFKINKQLSLLKLDATKNELEGQQAKLALVIQEYTLQLAMGQITVKQGEAITKAALAMAGLQGAINAVGANKGLVSGQKFSSGGGGGGSASSPASAKNPLASLAAPNSGLSFGRQRSRSEAVRDEADAVIAALEDYRDKLALGASGQGAESLAFADKRQAAALRVLEIEKEKQRELHTIRIEAAIEEEARADEEENQTVLRFGRIASAYADTLRTVADQDDSLIDGLAGVADIAAGVAEAFVAVKKGAPGALQAAGKTAKSLLGDRKEYAYIMAALAVADAALAFSRYDYVAGGFATAAAASYLLAAGRAGGGGSKGSAAPGKAPTQRFTSGDASAGATVININAPLLSTAQEAAHYLSQIGDSAQGTGFGGRT